MRLKWRKQMNKFEKICMITIFIIAILSVLCNIKQETRIKELKELGYEFRTEWESSKNRFKEPVSFKRYYLADIVSENGTYNANVGGSYGNSN